jgi:hypothetical protein
LKLLREKAVRRGANPDYLDMEVVEAYQFNMIRGFHTIGKNIRVRAQIKPGLIRATIRSAGHWNGRIFKEGRPFEPEKWKLNNMLRAKHKTGLVFFPAFDWAISPTHPEREERLLYTQDQVFEEGLLDIEGIVEYKPDLVTIKDVQRVHFCVPDPWA